MALLTLLSLPWMALAVTRVGAHVDALGAELIEPLYMTGIEACARAVALAMAVATLCNTMRLWTRLSGQRVGVVAGAIAAANGTLVYYAHTGNLEVPYLFWLTWTLVELDRVVCGEPREVVTLRLAAAAVLTKDQAAAALILPLFFSLIVVPWTQRRTSPFRPRLVRGAVIACVGYAAVSGALTNPVGFGRRIAFLLGPASQSWALYPRGVHGSLLLLRDALLATPHFTSFPIAVAAVVGLGLAVGSRRGVDRARALAPFVAGLSFTAFFTFGARRSEDRFLLPQSLLFLPYAALALDYAWRGAPRVRTAMGVVAFACAVPAVLGVVSLDATLLADPRYAAERFLGSLPRQTRIEVYGGPIFLPRIPTGLVAVRPGIEPLSERQAIAGVTDVVDPWMDPRTRAPEYIVLSTELSDESALNPPPASRPFALLQYADATSHALFRGLSDGSLGYTRVLRAVCTLPFHLECRSIHGSTAGEVWVYARR